MSLHSFFFRVQHDAILRLGRELSTAEARVAELELEVKERLERQWRDASRIRILEGKLEELGVRARGVKFEGVSDGGVDGWWFEGKWITCTVEPCKQPRKD